MVTRVLSRTSSHLLKSPIPKPIPSIQNQIRIFSSTPSSQSHHKNLSNLTHLFQRYGFPPSELNNFLNKNRFLLNSNTSELKQSLNILQSLCSCKNTLVSTVYACPRVLNFEFLKKWELTFLQLGVLYSNSLVVQNVLEVSRRFDLYPLDFSRCVRCLRGIGFSEVTVTRVLEVFPMVITTDEKRIQDSIKFFAEVGFQRDEIDRVVRMFPGVLAYSMEKKLKPLFDEFKDMGFGLHEVRKEIIRDPRVLAFEVGEISKCLRMLKSLKCREPIKRDIFWEGEFRAGYEAKLRNDCLCKHGLIRNDAFGVLWREPRVIMYDIEEIEKKIEFLVAMMKFDIGWLNKVPEYLGMHFEKQIVPRYSVIQYLRSKGGLGDEVGLKSLVKLSRLRFYNLYVKPYPECGKIYGRFVEDVKVNNRHPVGMWKLFKPKISRVQRRCEEHEVFHGTTGLRRSSRSNKYFPRVGGKILIIIV